LNGQKRSANASKTKPAKLLAVFVVDTNETELTIPFGNWGLIRDYCRGNPADLLFCRAGRRGAGRECARAGIASL